VLETDMIVFSAGIRPQDELGQNALAVGPRGGIAIDDHCRTSDPDIYAIGECAAWRSALRAGGPRLRHGPMVARHIAGGQTDKPALLGADMSTKLKLMGVDVASIGDAQGKTPKPQLPLDRRAKQIYKKIVVSEDGKHLLGAVLVGDADEYGDLLQMMLNDIALPEAPGVPDPARQRRQAQARPGRGCPARQRQICSCNNVSKGQICAAVAAASPPCPP
jgi:nitrite reductase (NADH) large subunit